MYTIVKINRIRCIEISTTFLKTNGYGVQMLYIFMGCVVKKFNKIQGMYTFYTIDSKVCHHRCAFKLYGEVNSVKKHNYKIWPNDGVY